MVFVFQALEEEGNGCRCVLSGMSILPALFHLQICSFKSTTEVLTQTNVETSPEVNHNPHSNAAVKILDPGLNTIKFILV